MTAAYCTGCSSTHRRARRTDGLCANSAENRWSMGKKPIVLKYWYWINGSLTPQQPAQNFYCEFLEILLATTKSLPKLVGSKEAHSCHYFAYFEQIEFLFGLKPPSGSHKRYKPAATSEYIIWANSDCAKINHPTKVDFAHPISVTVVQYQQIQTPFPALDISGEQLMLQVLTQMAAQQLSCLHRFSWSLIVVPLTKEGSEDLVFEGYLYCFQVFLCLFYFSVCCNNKTPPSPI